MTLQTQLADLQRQKKAAARDLHRTYVHTKRDLKRAVSPDRMIRRHLGAAIGAAAVAGLLLAPAPSRHAKAEAQPPHNGKKLKTKSRKLRWALGLVRHFLPQAAAYIPGLDQPGEGTPDDADTEPPEPAKKKKPRTLRTIIAPLLLDMVALLLKNVNFQALLTSWLGRRQKEHPPKEWRPDDAGEPGTQDSAAP